jgi:hypothetical protein
MSEQVVDYDTVHLSTIDKSQPQRASLSIVRPGLDVRNDRATECYLKMLAEDLASTGESIASSGLNHYDAPGDMHAVLCVVDEETEITVFHPRAQKVASCLFNADWTVSDREAAGMISLPQMAEDGLPHERDRLMIHFGKEVGRLAVRDHLLSSQRERMMGVIGLVTDLKSRIDYR